MSEWITDELPDFREFGFHIPGMKVRFRLTDGTEHEDIYQGWGIFGSGRGHEWEHNVTAWRPSDDPNGERT